MKDRTKRILRDGGISLLILSMTLIVSVVLQNILSIDEHITTVFVFAVFIISLCTEGYFFGIFSAFLSMIAINFAFTFPYLAFNFTIPENFISALVMITISVFTSALTTRLKKWQAMRAEAEKEKMRANLLRAVSHDLRTPLTTIYGSSSAILDGYEGFTDEQKKKMIFGIKEDTEWLIRIVENLLSITKIDSANVKVIKSSTVLDELIDSVILKFKKRYPGQNVNISLPEELVMIPMDALLIEQVLVNILENAVQHAKGMTRIDLSVAVESGRAVFEIADDGCGIERDRLDKIFTGYYDDREAPSDGGRRNAGIGLSVCATIIKAHGGSITAENPSCGGAVFRFSLNTEEVYDDQQ
jgi:two-component system sensor histidine kinase KdpD